MLECALEGRVADFRSRRPTHDGLAPLDAEDLREIYFLLDADSARGKAGLRVRGAHIQGALNLAGASGRGGSALPGLSLVECLIDEVIDVSDSRLFSLILTKSRLTGVQGRGVVIDGELDISGVEPPSANAPAFVNVRSGRIAGNIYAKRAQLYGPEDAPIDEAFVKDYRYALRLTETTIGNSVYLTEGVYAHGGVVIRDSDVGGNIWADGARVEALDGYAFSIRGSRIKGGVRLTNNFTAIGAVCARQTRIDGSLRLDGGSFSASDEPLSRAKAAEKPKLLGMDRALDMERVTVLGDVSLGMPGESFELADQQTTVTGDISLAGATIDGDLSWSNLVVRPKTVGQPILFNLEAVKVERRLRAHHLIDDTPRGDAPLTFRLRATRVGLLHDVWRDSEATMPWGTRRARLEMDGFRYSLSSTRDVVSSSAVTELETELAQADRWSTRARVSVALFLARLGRTSRFLQATLLRRYPGPAKARLDWLNRLYPQNRLGMRIVNRKTFRSQPYAQAARAFAEVGLDGDAREVQLQQLRHIRRTGRLLRVPDRWLYDALFGYGIAPWRAIRTLILAFLIGWFGVWRANTGGMLELKVQPTSEMSQLVERERVAGGGSTLMAVEGRTVQAPCGREINNALYALDVFIPLVDLRQDSECEIPPDPIPLDVLMRAAGTVDPTIAVETYEWVRALGGPDELIFDRQIPPLAIGPVTLATNETDFWRVSRALYALSGWVLLSLSILTFSGILRPRS